MRLARSCWHLYHHRLALLPSTKGMLSDVLLVTAKYACIDSHIENSTANCDVSQFIVNVNFES